MERSINCWYQEHSCLDAELKLKLNLEAAAKGRSQKVIWYKKTNQSVLCLHISILTNITISPFTIFSPGTSTPSPTQHTILNTFIMDISTLIHPMIINFKIFHHIYQHHLKNNISLIDIIDLYQQLSFRLLYLLSRCLWIQWIRGNSTYMSVWKNRIYPIQESRYGSRVCPVN